MLMNRTENIETEKKTIFIVFWSMSSRYTVNWFHKSVEYKFSTIGRYSKALDYGYLRDLRLFKIDVSYNRYTC